MARTNKNEVHSEAPVTRLSTSRKISIDDQLESVRRLFNMLVAFCVGHLILSVVAATLFGVYISEHANDIDSLKQTAYNLQTEMTTGQQQINNSEITTNVPNANMLLSDLETIHNRIDTIENVTDEYGAALSKLEQNMNIQEKALQNNTYQTMTTIDRLYTDFESQGDTVLYLNETVTKLNALVHSNRPNNGSNAAISKLSQLEADINSSKAIVEDYVTRTTELEGYRAAHQTMILNLDTEISGLKANRTSDNTDMKSSILQIETKIENNRKLINETIIDTDNLEERMNLEREKYNNLSVNLFNLQEDTMTTKAEVQNNTAEILDIKGLIGQLNETLEAQLNIAQYLISNLTYLEAELDATVAATLNYTDGLASSLLSLEELEKDTTKLSERLTEVADAMNCTWSDWDDFSTCSVPCGDGTKYRTRTCAKSNHLSPDWLPRTETDIQPCNSQACSVLQIGFSASGNTKLSGSIIHFDSIKTNYGSGYSSSTGKFTCSHPGLYFFSVSLIKKRDLTNIVDWISCHIYQNSESLINTWIDPTDDDTDKGCYETSAFLTIHLSMGDQVYVTCAVGILDGLSSFSGFLLKSD